MSLEMVFWDVQHGSATYIKTPNETHIVQDLGIGDLESGDDSFSPLKYLQDKYGVRQLDYVIVTHPHKDHIDDIMYFDRLNPRTFLRPKHLSKEDVMKNVRDEDKALFEKYYEIEKRYSASVQDDSNPELPRNNGGVTFKRFHPTSCSTSNINNHSIVNVINYAGSKIVLPGDNESPSWQELLDMDGFIEAIKDSDILLAPHHGRDSGFHQEVMNIINPRLTIVSDGPWTDTSATDLYSQISRGWTVYKRSGGNDMRYCVTTRRDGAILVKFGYDVNGDRFISVGIN